MSDCKHEWFEGRCVHCEVTPSEAKAASELGASAGSVAISIGERNNLGMDEMYVNFYKCPKCGTEIVMRIMHYCPICGRKLLWEKPRPQNAGTQPRREQERTNS